MALSGLEVAVRSVITNQKRDKVHLSIYADDFIITSAIQEVLIGRVKPIVEEFLSERGLTLSQDKTRTTHIETGLIFSAWT